MERLDVAILAGGMVGSLPARQLLRSAPDLRVGLFEREPAHDCRVGESTAALLGKSDHGEPASPTPITSFMVDRPLA